MSPMSFTASLLITAEESQSALDSGRKQLEGEHGLQVSNEVGRHIRLSICMFGVEVSEQVLACMRIAYRKAPRPP